MSDHTVINADSLKILARMPENSVDAIVTDPPYGLAPPMGEGKRNSIIRTLFDVVFPNLDKVDPALAQVLDLSGVPLDGSRLSRLKAAFVVEAGIGVPKRAVNLESNIPDGDHEIDACDKTPRVEVSDPHLSGVVDPETSQDLGHYILDLRDAGESAFRDRFGRGVGELALGRLSMPVVPALLPGNGCFLSRLALGLPPLGCVHVGLGHDSRGEAGGSSGVHTSRGAVDGFVLGFDVARGSFELRPAKGAGENNTSTGTAPQLVRANTAASSLPPVFQSVKVRLVGFETDRTNTLFFHIWVDLKKLKSTLNKLPKGGFMGKKWDKALPDPAIWRECLRVLKPGGHALIFGAPRLYHRLACQVEDQGFQIRDCVIWMFGSGFPKSLNISKALDKLHGAEREVIGRAARPDGSTRTTKKGRVSTPFVARAVSGDAFLTAPATPEAKHWDGFGTALKPAYEPILLARKPLSGTVARNVLEHGTGGLNIDGCRVPSQDFDPKPRVGATKLMEERPGMTRALEQGTRPTIQEGHEKGRWPANIILDPEAGAALDAQTGVLKSGARAQGDYKRQGGQGGQGGHGIGPMPAVKPSKGGASRFFYCSKASRSERERGLDGMSLFEVECLPGTRTLDEGETWENVGQKAHLRVVTEQSRARVIGVSGTQNNNVTEWNTLLFGNVQGAPFPTDTSYTTSTGTKSTTASEILSVLAHLHTKGSTAGASCDPTGGGSLAKNADPSTTSITITSDRTVFLPGVGRVMFGTRLKISDCDAKGRRARRCDHPTVKPIDLMRYLVRLITPPGGLVLDPFTGSGSTGVAAALEGFRFLGFELDPNYVKIAQARIKGALK